MYEKNADNNDNFGDRIMDDATRETDAEVEEEAEEKVEEIEEIPIAIIEGATRDELIFNDYLRETDPRRKAALRDRLVAAHTNLVRFLVKKFANRGELIDDLISVGIIGLIHAIDRFDPSRGIRFATFATPTIVGEIKRHFRDKGWAIKVPRRLQEINLASNRAVEALTRKLNRPPTAMEVADHIGVSLEDTLEGMELGHMYELISLDGELNNDDDDGHSRLEDYIGQEDSAFEEYMNRTHISEAINRLSPREKRVILMRFFNGKSQTDVAKEMNISQMHVSRLQHKALSNLKKMMRDEMI
ncbi:MAG: SigB/SigF/SigG family RNA polymerase sigma factor [bacterium]